MSWNIYVGKNKTVCLETIWEEKLQQVEKVLNIWNTRKLTYLGKSVVINSLVIPKLIYCMTIVYMPEDYIRKLEKLIFAFLWGKYHKIKKCTVFGSHQNGGLNIIDIESKVMSLKSSWIPKLLGKGIQSSMVDMLLTPLGLNLELLLKMSFRNRDNFSVIKKLPDFYQ